MRHEGVGEEDFAPKFKHKKKAKRKPRKRGCPGNDGNEHVYDWHLYEFNYSNARLYGDEDVYVSKCIGCGRREKRQRKIIKR